MPASRRRVAPLSLLFLSVWLLLACWTGPALAAEQIIFGPTYVTCTVGGPTQFSATIEPPPTLTAPFRLHIQNGAPDGDHWILAATITLNGGLVAAPWDFYTLEHGFEIHPVRAFDRSVTLHARNTLQVRLLGLPGGFLVLTLYGTVPPPTLRTLAPPALPLSQGGTGILTATVSAIQQTDAVMTLQSSNPAVATVPATVTIPANQLTVPIPVSGVAPGTATITASLNGSSLQSAITVHPAGPTLTSLLPATLQVTQGASGSLTLTMSAGQPTDTVVALTSSAPGTVGLPPAGMVTVPAGQLSQTFAVFGGTPGHATITATLNGSSVQSQLSVVIPLPTVVSLLPPVLPLTEGSSGTLTVTLNASQPMPSDVFLSTSDASIVGLPGDRITVPANALTAAVPIIGRARGMTTVTASLTGSTATAAITVAPPPPMVQSLACPASLTAEATGQCSLSLNATQLTDTVVSLRNSDTGVVTLPGTVTIPANTVMAPFAVSGGSVGSSTITAGPLNGTSRTATIQVLLPPPTIVSLIPSPATLFVGATGTLTLTLNAAQLVDTAVPLAVATTGILSVPATVTVPAGSLSAPVTVAGLTLGRATLTAGPLNGTQAQSTLTVNQFPPTLTALEPSSVSLPKGKVGVLTLTVEPTQPEATIIPLTSSDPTSVEVPISVTVPAGARAADVPFLTRGVGTAILTVGPLNGTSQQLTITVTPAELVALVLTPPAPTIAKGQTQEYHAIGTYTDGTAVDLSATAAWTSSNEATSPITSSGGVATGLLPGQVTITATVGSLSATATLTVTPPILANIAITPANPTSMLGQSLLLTAMGTLTDNITQDMTGQVIWRSGDSSIATVSPAGVITPLAVGSTTITATHPDGFTASTTLTVLLAPPTLTGFSPSGGPVGSSVTLTGTNLDSTTRVAFNGIPAAFAVRSSIELTATVPIGATTGPIIVTTPSGSVGSLGSFSVLAPLTLTITSPTDGATINATSVQVRGTVSGATSEIGVLVNGLPAAVNTGQWVVEVPLVVGTNTLEARAVDALGITSLLRITVTASQTTPPSLLLLAAPESGIAPLTTIWQVRNQSGRPLVQFELDPTGTGSFGSPVSTFDGTQTAYATPGLFHPVLRAMDDKGVTYTATTTVNVLSRDQLDATLQTKWASMKGALGQKDVEGALAFFAPMDRERYRTIFSAMQDDLPQIAQDIANIQLIYLIENRAKYRLRRTEVYGGQQVTLTYYVYFIQDLSGAWRIEGF
jgi:uncharacterized protein YjdB